MMMYIYSMFHEGCCNCYSNVLVLRVGGQSTDLAVIAVSSGMYQILSSLHIPGVGGRQIDDLLVEHFAAEFQKFVHTFDSFSNDV